MTQLRAPFPYFGGKSRVAPIVWRAFGAGIPNYVEPFAGSLAVLLGRPGGAGKVETVNDKDAYVSNFWRAVSWAPDEVVHYADWPVNEVDLTARHRWLTEWGKVGLALAEDPNFFDAKVAGWWLSGICSHIGTGFCSEKVGARRLPCLGNHGRGINGSSAPPLSEWIGLLRKRLRRVRVANGDWTRVLGSSVLGGTNLSAATFGMTPCGVFLDPPYTGRFNDKTYAEEESGLAVRVAAWARERGDNPRLRIAFCGYDGEHKFPDSWTCHAWKTKGGYGAGRTAKGSANQHRERIWFSPYCFPIEP